MADIINPYKPYKVAPGASSLPPLHPVGGAAGSILPEKNSWDAVTIAGDLLPGHASVQGAAIAVKLQDKSAHGKNGGKPTICGIDTQVSFTVTCEVWTDNQLKELERITAGIVNDMATDPANAAFRFDAPQTRGLGISLIIVERVGQLELASRGMYRRVFTCKPFIFPKNNAVGTPKKAKSKRGKNEVEKAADAKANPLPTDQKGLTGPKGQVQEFREVGGGRSGL